MRERAEVHLRLVRVVTSAPERNVGDCGFSAQRERLDVVELEQGALRAASAGLGYERALPSVPHPHGPLHRRRDVPRSGPRRPRGPRHGRRRGLLLRYLCDEESQRPLDDRAGIAVRDLAPQEVLGQA